MVFVSRFAEERTHFEEVAGCPLSAAQTARAAPSEAACARCRYNVVFPKLAQIGCTLRTPPAIVDAARAAAPTELSAELSRLRGLGAVEGDGAQAWADLGARWLQQANAKGDEAGRELASVMLRFARGALAGLGPVEVLS